MDDISVEVKNKVPRTIKRSFEEIAAAADNAQSRVERLMAMLDKLDGKSAGAALMEQKLARAIAQTANETNKALLSASKMMTHRNGQALSEQRLAQQLARTSSEQDKAALSALRLSSARERAARASEKAARGTGVGSNFARGVVSGGGIGSSARGALAGAAIDAGPLVLAAGAVTAALGTAGAAFVSFGDKYNGLQNILKNVTGGFEANGMLLGNLARIANDTAKPIESVVEGFARFDRTLKPLGKTQQETLQFTDTLNRMLFAYGKSAGESASVTLQLSQAMGKGKLDGDEFKSVMENLPELGTAIAKELGVAKGQLIELAPKGKITGDVIYNAMQRAKESIAALPEPIIRIETALTKVDNNLTLLLGSLEEGSGIVASFAKSISNLGDNLGYVAEQLNKANTLEKDFSTAEKIKNFLGVTDEWMTRSGLAPGLIEEIRQLARAQQEAVLNYKKAIRDNLFGIPDELKAKLQGEIAGAQDALLAKLTEAQGKVETLRAAETARISQGEALNKQIQERNTLEKTELEALRERVRVAGLSEREQFVENELAKLTKKIKGQELSNAFLAEERALLEKLYDLQNKKDDKQEEKREVTLAKINAQLDNELGRLTMVAEERAKQERFDRIDESLITKKIELTDEETASIKERIAAIESGQAVQRELDALYNDTHGALEQYNATLEANEQLLKAGDISYNRYLQNIMRASREYARTLDPLSDLNDQMAKEVGLLEKSSRERDIERKVIDATNAALEKGRALGAAEIEQLRARLVAHRELTEQLQANSDMLDAATEAQRKLTLEANAYLQTRAELQALGVDAQSRQKVANDNGLDLEGTRTAFQANIEIREQAYARADELRRLEIINEQEASTAKERIWAKEQESKLSLAQTFFNSFVGLSESKNKEIAAIGKAAAIANATIQMYSGAVSAYTAMAGIPVIGPGLGAAAAAGVIAAGVINIANIAAEPVGFKQGGYTGSAAVDKVAGVVHGREYVIDAANTARLGRGNLDALRSGGAAIASNDNERQRWLNVTLIVVNSREEADSEAAREQNDTMVMQSIGRKRSQAKLLIGSG